MIKNIFILLITAITIGSVTAQDSDSLKQELNKLEGYNRIPVLHELILSVWLNYPDQGMLYGYEALEISKAHNDSTNISKSLRLLAGVHYYKGDYDASLDFNLQALEIGQLLKDSVLINNGYNNIGLLYYNLGSYQSALEFLLRALDIKEKLGEKYGLPTTLNNIGLVYEKVLNFNMARKYFFEALSLSKSENRQDQIVYSQNNIGTTYLRQGNEVAAKQYFERSLKLAETIGNINWGAASCRGLGQVLEKNGNYDSSKYYYQKSLEASKSIDDKQGMAEVYYLFSKLANRQNDNLKALEYLDKGHNISNKLGIRQQLLDNLSLYVKIYGDIDNKNKIIEYQDAYTHLKDSLFQDVVSRNLALVPIKIKEEQERLKVSKQQAEISKKDFTNTVLLLILIIATPIIIVLILLIRNNVSTNRKLTGYNTEVLSQKEEIETQKEVLEFNNKELESAKNLIDAQKNELEILNRELSKTVDIQTSELKHANEELRVINLELDNLIYKSSHDIRGPLVRLMGVCNLALMEVKDEKAIEYFRMLDKAAKRLNNTVDKLKIVSELDRKEIVNSKINFLLLIKQNLDQNKYIEGLENVEVETEIAENLAFYSDPSVIDLILFNMIQNAVQLLKSAKSESKKLKVKIDKNESLLKMTFDIENIELVINEEDGFFKMLSKDDDSNQNFGIGLYTVKQCVQKLGGELLLVGDALKATRFTINLPLHIRL